MYSWLVMVGTLYLLTVRCCMYVLVRFLPQEQTDVVLTTYTSGWRNLSMAAVTIISIKVFRNIDILALD